MTELNTDQMKRVEALGYVKELFDDTPDLETALTLADWILGQERRAEDTGVKILKGGSVQTRTTGKSWSYIADHAEESPDDRAEAILRITRVINPFPLQGSFEDEMDARAREDSAVSTATVIVDMYGLRDSRTA